MPVAHLDDRAVIRIAGTDAATLLQNVVTLDVPGVDAHGSGYGALLTPQGKILWDFLLHKIDDGYAIDIRAEEAEAFAKRMKLYRLRAKVEIETAPDLAVYAAWSDAGGEGPADPRVAELGERWVAPAGSVKPNASSAEWHRHRIALAVPEGGIDFGFGDAFPSDAAMDALHGVAYEKGCFVGQEVVSRMKHRGTGRRRIVSLSASAALPEPGADLTADGKPLGRLGSSADGHGVAVVRLDRTRAALDAGQAILAGSEAVGVTLPSWATYGWPATATAGDE
jgi:folate-binding protein YgfZ